MNSARKDGCGDESVHSYGCSRCIYKNCKSNLSDSTGGSATVAAVVMEHPEEVGGKNVALIMSGGNIDEDLMIKLLSEA